MRVGKHKMVKEKGPVFVAGCTPGDNGSAFFTIRKGNAIVSAEYSMSVWTNWEGTKLSAKAIANR